MPSTVGVSTHLIRPSSHIPWDVQVTGDVPSSLIVDLPQTVRGCLHGNWACLLMGKNLHLWNTTTTTTTTTTSTTTTTFTGDTKKPFKLYHPKLYKNHVLLSVYAANDCIHVYAVAHSATDKALVMVWLIRPTQRISELGQSPSCKSFIEGETLTTIQAMEGGILFGTNTNTLYIGHLIPKPLTLTIQKLTKTTATTGGFLGYVFGNTNTSTPAEDSVNAILIVDKTLLVTLTNHGHVELYNVTRKAGVISCDHATLGSLKDLLEEQDIQVMQAASIKKEIHVVCSVNDKIYYVNLTVNESSLTLNKSEWLCRFQSSVQCTGIVATDDDMVYAIMTYPNESVTCLALNKSMEVDLPVIQVSSVLLLGKDSVTHGCQIVTSTGLLVRARWMQLQNTVTPSNATHNPMLATHLSSTFWLWYRSATAGVPIPPSLLTAKPFDLEAATIAVALQLQQAGDASTLKNPMEWHLSFVTFLKQNGLYRSVSNQGRWTLLGIGQELAVHATLESNHPLVQNLLPHGVATKLQLVQEHVLQYPTDQNHWCVVLCVALQTAQQYRIEHAMDTYDILQEQPSSKLWTHQSTLQQVLVNQMEYWRDSGTILDPTQVEVVAKATLSSFSESSHKHYELIKALAIPLVRVIKDDVLAFNLSEEHCWYDGLCQLSLDHRKEDYFQIDTLLKEWDESFGRFVLQWHSDRRKFGQVLRHGQHTPNLLTEFLEADNRLHPYRWIHTGRMEDYDTAATQLMENAELSTKLQDTKWALSMAMLSNKVSKSPSKRKKLIDAKLELVKAQEILSTDDGPLKSPEQLLHLVMDQVKESTALENTIQLCLTGLSIAKASDDLNKVSMVWSIAILKDQRDWEYWIANSNNLTSTALRNTILDKTVFGGLWKAMQGLSLEYHSVQYDTPFEEKVIDALGFDAVGQTEMKRLLRAVTSVVLTTTTTNAGSRSLVLSSHGN